MPEELEQQQAETPAVKRLTTAEELKPIFDAAVKKHSESITDEKERAAFIKKFGFKSLPSNIFEMSFDKGGKEILKRKLARVPEKAAIENCERFVLEALRLPIGEEEDED